MVMMADVTLSAAQYRTQVEGMGIDCAYMVGCIPLLNTNSEEHSWFQNVNFYNTGGEYARITEVATAGPGEGGPPGAGSGDRGVGAANSGPYFDWSGNLLNEICELASPATCNGVTQGNFVNETTVAINPLTCETLGLLVDGPAVGTFPQNVIKKIFGFTLTLLIAEATRTTSFWLQVYLHSALACFRCD